MIMNKKNILLALVVLLTITWYSCTKESDPLDPVPSIELVDVAPDQVVEYQDSIIFTISYKDGDGDLGENDPDVKNVYVKDLRNQVEYKFRLQQLAPDDANIPIQGTFTIVLPHTAIIGTDNTETVKYQIYVTDRSGNTSNTVTTADITVVR